MQTINLQIEDTIYESIKKNGIDIKKELTMFIDKLVYSKEHKIADDINNSLEDVKNGKTKPLSELLNEV